MELFANVKNGKGEIVEITSTDFSTKKDFKSYLHSKGFKVRFISKDTVTDIKLSYEKYEEKKATAKAKRKAKTEPVENAEPVENTEPVGEPVGDVENTEPVNQEVKIIPKFKAVVKKHNGVDIECMGFIAFDDDITKASKKARKLFRQGYSGHYRKGDGYIEIFRQENGRYIYDTSCYL